MILSFQRSCQEAILLLATMTPKMAAVSEGDGDVKRDLCVENTVYLLEEEYECLRSMFLDEDQCMGEQFSAWKSCCMVKDPPPWNELLAAPCTGSCNHILVVLGVCSWLGMLKIALMQHGVPNPNRLHEQMQNFYDSYFLCSKPTLVKRSSQVLFTTAEQRGINFLFLCHENKNIFRVSPSPPHVQSQQTLATLYQSVGTGYDMSQEAHEQRKWTSAREAAVPLVRRRKGCADYCSEDDVGVCCDGGGGGVVAASGFRADTDELDIWQGFNEELPRAVAHITQQLVEQGTLPNAYSVRVLKREDQLLRAFGPNLEQYVQDMGDLLFPADGIPRIKQRNIVEEGIEKGLLSAGSSLLVLPSSSEDGEVEDLGSVDSSSEESESDDTTVDSSKVAEEATTGESDALSNHMFDESMDLL